MLDNEYHSGGGTNEINKEASDRSQTLTNDDFRKLLMAPRRSVPSSLPSSSAFTRDAVSLTQDEKTDHKGEKRRKKKIFYAKLQKEEAGKMSELAKKYRDRASERRDGVNPDYQAEEPAITTNAYHAVAPDLKTAMDAAERRHQIIQESKFLGGDMQHTHLVKGLDYALLKKVRSEIKLKEHEQEDMKKTTKTNKERGDEAEEVQFKTKMGRNIYRVLFKSKPPERNELFYPGRMAYVIDLKDEFPENDIPTTLIRSRADVPSLEPTATLTTNDMVINKLTQVLSYLRQGKRYRKKSKKNKDKGRGGLNGKSKDLIDESIYGDIGDYVPSLTRRDTKNTEKDTRKKRAPYFENSAKASCSSAYPDSDDINAGKQKEEVLDQPDEPQFPQKQELAQNQSRAQQLLARLAAEPEGYAECYPGLDEMQVAIEESDDEVDYSKMDLGNRKGLIKRWDFDTQEEYSAYMNNREALPKAAFQYGVKVADGRRTRKYHKEKNEKAEFDRQWQKIQNYMQKRIVPEAVEPKHKKSKY